MSPVQLIPIGPIYWQKERDRVRSGIAKAERFADAYARAFACFVPGSVERMGIEEIGQRFVDLASTCKEYLTEPYQGMLAEIDEQEELSTQPMPPPTPEELYSAQRNVEILEAGIENMRAMKSEDHPGFELAEAALMPQYESMLLIARDKLAHLQSRADKATQASMSNETTKPAKPT